MGKLFDSKFKVMEPLWNDGSQPAGALARRAGGQLWLENTLIGTVLILAVAALRRLLKGCSCGRYAWPGCSPQCPWVLPCPSTPLRRRDPPSYDRSLCH